MKKVKRLKPLIFFNIFGILSFAAVTISSCANEAQTNLVFGNFESYMSPDLQNELQDKYSNLSFDYYSSNENMISNFKNGTYTIGVPSTYALIELAKSNQIQKIDWSRFGLHMPDDPTKQITTATDALSLFSEPVQNILQGYKTSFGIDNLLEYSVPYFFQDYIFAYRGPKIDEFSDPLNPPTWSNILDYVGTHPERFNNGRFGAVEDERSLFSVAKLIKNVEESTPGAPISVNPKINDPKPSIDDYINVFENLSSGNRINATTLGDNPVPIFLNSDSNAILNRLALGTLNGAMLYNGDAIFSALGGDVVSDTKPTGDNFHIVTPKYTPLALDLMVINKTTTENNPALLDESYQIIKKVGLENSDETDPTLFQAELPAKNSTGDPLYVNGPMQNFSYILYTSPLKIISGLNNKDNLNSVIKNKDGGFFDNEDSALTDEINSAYYAGDNIPPKEISNFVESPINAFQKQAMINAYLRFKEKMWN